MDVVGYALAAAVPESQVVENESWIAKASSSYDLFEFGMDVFPDNRVVVAGGGSTSSSTSGYPYVRIYNPDTNTWTSETNMAQGRKGNIVAVCGVNKDKLLIAGGMYYNYQSSPYWFSGPAYLYDINTNTYTTAPNSTNGKTYGWGGGLSDGRAVFTGGISGESRNQGSQMSQTYVYDPATNVFTQFTGASTMGHHGIGGAMLDDGLKFIIVNGTSPGGSTSNGAIVADIVANTATSKAVTLARRQGPAVFRLPNGRVASVGGSVTSGSDMAEVLDIAANVWTWGPMYSVTPRYEARAVTLSDGRAVIMGGNNTPRVVEMLSPTRTIITPGIKTVKAYLAAN